MYARARFDEEGRKVLPQEDLHLMCKPGERSAEGWHRHECACGTAWQHPHALEQGTKEQFWDGHTCPSCGAEVLEKADWAEKMWEVIFERGFQ